jgi:predicted TIM-barrel fold metal-dependent hydrolase
MLLRHFKSCVISLIALSTAVMNLNAETIDEQLPIIDVHVHAMKIGGTLGPMCPWFLTDMPGADPHLPPPAFINTDCDSPLQPAASTEDYQNKAIAEAERLNVTMVVGGDDEVLRNMKALSPDRVIPSLSFSSADDISLEDFRAKLKSGYYKVVGEVAPQYKGMSPADMSLDPYFAVAEELKIPVAIHMGTGGNGMANITAPNYRASVGHPFELEALLERHPKLKIWVMHAGYPMADAMIALMGAHAYVYVDVAGMIWSYPYAEVNRYIERIATAGFAKRIMYGTDLLLWPGLLETSINLIKDADYLSESQKRDILFNNAVRFFNLDSASFYK